MISPVGKDEGGFNRVEKPKEIIRETGDDSAETKEKLPGGSKGGGSSVGPELGASLGDCEGKELGNTLGVNDGCFDGVVDGSNDGEKDGFAEIDGKEDGTEEGEAERDGFEDCVGVNDCVGVREGVLLGDTVGEKLGLADGFKLCDGRAVGMELSDGSVDGAFVTGEPLGLPGDTVGAEVVTIIVTACTEGSSKASL